MGNTQTRLIGWKQQAVRKAVGRSIGWPITTKLAIDLMKELSREGLQVNMIGGDMVWSKDEQPPTVEEILTRTRT